MEQLKALYEYDALGYIDREIEHPAVQAAVQQLIEQEMATFRPNPEMYLKDYPYPKLGERLQGLLREHDESAKGLRKKEGVDISQYTIEVPPAPSSSALNSDRNFPFEQSCGAWNESISRAKSMVEYQENRLQHLEMQMQHIPPLWLQQIAHAENSVAQLEKVIKDVESECNSVNSERMREQEVCGRDLAIAQRKRDAAIAGQLALQSAIAQKKSKAF